MTKIRKSKIIFPWKVLVIEHLKLRFACILVFGICIFLTQKSKAKPINFDLTPRAKFFLPE